jgi:hypothetical protein
VGASRASIFLGVLALGACKSEAVAGVVVPSASVNFVLDAPLCSSTFIVQFSIDSLVVGTDTFRVNLPNPHTTSRVFGTSAGTHTLGAEVTGGAIIGGSIGPLHPWPDRGVTIVAGQAFPDSLPFYCS